MQALKKFRICCAVAPVVAALVAAAPTSAQFGGTDVNIDPSPVVQNEISLTLVPGTTPGQPQVLVAAYNDNPYPGGYGLGISYSTDGGITWNSSQLPFPTSGITGATLVDAFDPTATVDTQGTLFVAHISTDGFIGSPSGVSGLYVRRSTDLGVSWSAEVEVSADPGSFGPPDPGFRFNDRCQIWADRFAASPYKDNIYLSWIKDRGWSVAPGPPPPYSDIYFSRSTDGGQTFSGALQINDVPGNDLGNMPVPRVAADGTVLVSWLDYNVWTGGTGRILLDKSTDGGVTWGADQLVATVSLPPLNVTTGIGATDALAKGAPVLATSPANANELYMVFAADPDGAGADEADVYLIRSTDQGATWGSPLRLNTDITTNDQILPWMDVKADGTIDVVWYDRRNDVQPLPGDRLWDVYFAQSSDGGISFLPELRLNDTSFLTPTAAGGPWLGEYPGLVVDSTHAYVAWTTSYMESAGDIHFDKLANQAAACPASPTASSACRLAAVAGASLVQIRNDSDNRKDLFKWAWKKGALTNTTDFGDPVVGSAVQRLCVYDSSAAAQPRMDMEVPSGATCGTKPCWKATGSSGYQFTDPAASNDGIRKLKLKSGIASKAQVQARGKGGGLPAPSLPLTMPVTVQLLINDGVTTECWQTAFTSAPINNDTVRFKAKGP